MIIKYFAKHQIRAPFKLFNQEITKSLGWSKLKIFHYVEKVAELVNFVVVNFFIFFFFYFMSKTSKILPRENSGLSYL